MDGAPDGSRGMGGDAATAQGAASMEIGTSRLSPGQMYRVIQSFSQFKRDLVTAIGFGGLLSLPNLAKLNLKFSMWLLTQVDLSSNALVVDDNHVLQFYEEDVERVFGIPCGPRKVDGPDASVTQEAVWFMRSALGLVGKDSHSLKRVECFLYKDISESSSRIEQECFQIAFVIYSMGHLLAPPVKHDYVTIDYWGALKSADHIMNYNWCEYVLRSVIEAARKVQTQAPTKGPITIPGCHLFLQVFFLDNMDVGAYKLPHTVFPRVAEYTPERLKVMIQKSVDCHSADEFFTFAKPRVAESVCYKRSKIESARSRGECLTPRRRVAQQAGCSYTQAPKVDEQPDPSGPQADACTTPSALPLQYYTNMDMDLAKYLHPGGLFEYLKLHYPDIVGSEVGDLLKRHNAMCVKHYVTHQRAIIKENIILAASLVDALGEKFIQSARRSRSSGSKRTNELNKDGSDSLMGQQLNFDDCEVQDETPASKRKKNLQPSLSTGSLTKKQRREDAKHGAAAGSGSCGRGRSLNSREDIPSFNLGIDDEDCLDVTGPLEIQIPAALDVRMSHATHLPAKHKQSPRSANKNFSDLIIGEMLVIQEEKRSTQDGKVLFGDATTTPIPRRKLETGDFAPNPFYNGHAHRRPTPENIMSLHVWVTSQYVKDMEKNWIIHPYPRHIELTGKDITEQLVGAERMDPDVFALLVRRFGQLDASMHTTNVELRWRHFLEPDFAVYALAGNDVAQLLSVQQQFIGDAVSYNLARCEMIVVPTKLIDGWVVYVWDMKKKLIHVMDPSRLASITDARRSLHEDISSVLHASLARCLVTYFEDWVISETPWTRFFPFLGSKSFTEQESGVVAAYLARNYDGRRVEIALNEEFLYEVKKRFLFDVLQMEGNMASLPGGVANAMRTFH